VRSHSCAGCHIPAVLVAACLLLFTVIHQLCREFCFVDSSWQQRGSTRTMHSLLIVKECWE
jgi:hypothetical protein